MRVRSAASSDALPIARVNVASWRVAYEGLLAPEKLGSLNESDLERDWLEHIVHPPPQQSIFVLEEGGEVIGYSRSGRNLDVALAEAGILEVYGFYIAPGAWGRGAGRQLMTHVLDDMRGQGVKAATLWVVERNLRARAFYEKLGWELEPGPTNTCFGAPEVRYRISL